MGFHELGYKVGEVAKIAGVSAATIRLWEHEGLVASTRSSSGYRYFDDEALDRVRRIAQLRRIEKLNTAGIRRALGEEAAGGRPRRREVALGPHLRRMRRERGLTLEQAASEAGLSPSFLSELERDQTGASMSTLHRLLRYYGTTVASILGGSDRQMARLKRAGRARSIRNRGVTVAHLTDGTALMEPQEVTVEPGAGSEGEFSHEGEEFLYVLEGTLEVTLESGERHHLRTGDSLYFPSTVAHSWRNPGRAQSRLVWVNTPPTF